MTHLKRLMEWHSRISGVRHIYGRTFGRYPSLLRPRRYSEKIQWRKLFGTDPSHAIFCDKLATRDYIAAKGFGHLLTELIWSGEDLDASPLRSLTCPFVLKSNHASAQYVLVPDPTSANYEEMAEKARQWLQIDYSEVASEAAYRGLPRRLMIERMILRSDGLQPAEHRVFVFHGKVRVIATMLVTREGVFSAFHLDNWTRLNWRGINPPYEPELPRPRHFEEMIAVAECLAKDDEHLRVDFYDDGEHNAVGEITVYTWSGLARLKPEAADRELGKFWNLRRPMRRALACIVFGRWPCGTTRQ